MFLNIQVFKGLSRWKFLSATNNISYASLLPFFCNWLSGFRTGQMVVHANDPGCMNWFENGESQININISRTIPEPSWLWICAEYQDVNWSFINFFASLLTVKSSSDEDEYLDFLLDIFIWNLCKLPLLITLDKMQNEAYQGIIYYLCRYINCTCRCWSCLSSSLWFKFLTMVFNFASIFIRKALISPFFYNRENREIKDARN